MKPYDLVYRTVLFLFPLCPVYLGLRFSGAGLLNIQRVMLIALLLMLAADACLSRVRGRWVLHVLRVNAPIWLALLLFLAWRLLSALASVQVDVSLKTAVSDALTALTLYFATLYYVTAPHKIARVLRTLLVAATAVAAFGLLERLLEANPIAALVPAGMTGDGFLDEALRAKVRGVYRAQSTFYNPLSLAHYLVLLLPLLLVPLQWGAARRPWLAGAALTLLVLCLWATGSRAGILLFGVAVLFGVAAGARRLLRHADIGHRVQGAVLILALVLAAGAVAFQAVRIVTGASAEEADSSQARLEQAMRGYGSIVAHPLLGIGPRMAANVAGVNLDAERVSVDNYYLSLSIESGLPATALFLLLGVLCARATLQQAKALRERADLAAEATALAGSIGLFMAFLLIVSLYEETLPLFVVLVAVVCTRRALLGRPQHPAPSRALVSGSGLHTGHPVAAGS